MRRQAKASSEAIASDLLCYRDPPALMEELLLPALIVNSSSLFANTLEWLDAIDHHRFEELGDVVSRRLFAVVFYDVLSFFLDQTFSLSSIRRDVDAICSAGLFPSECNSQSKLLFSNVMQFALRLAPFQHLKRFYFVNGRSTHRDEFDSARDHNVLNGSSTGNSGGISLSAIFPPISWVPSGSWSVEVANRLTIACLQRNARCRDLGLGRSGGDGDALALGPHRTGAKVPRHSNRSNAELIPSSQPKVSLLDKVAQVACVDRHDRGPDTTKPPASSARSRVRMSTAMHPLPVELQRAVLLFLTPRALVCAEATCRLWHAIISRNVGMLRMVQATRQARAVFTAFMEEEWGERFVDTQRLRAVRIGRMISANILRTIRNTHEDAAAGASVAKEEVHCGIARWATVLQIGCPDFITHGDDGDAAEGGAVTRHFLSTFGNLDTCAALVARLRTILQAAESHGDGDGST